MVAFAAIRPILRTIESGQDPHSPSRQIAAQWAINAAFLAWKNADRCFNAENATCS
jgi:hypothetical protein